MGLLLGAATSSMGRAVPVDALTSRPTLGLDAARHRGAMNDSFGEVVTTLSQRATSAVLSNRSVGDAIFLMGERPQMAEHCRP